jgi:hypothetical protein
LNEKSLNGSTGKELKGQKRNHRAAVDEHNRAAQILFGSMGKAWFK